MLTVYKLEMENRSFPLSSPLFILTWPPVTVNKSAAIAHSTK